MPMLGPLVVMSVDTPYVGEAMCELTSLGIAGQPCSAGVPIAPIKHFAEL
jgi:hypothetical protein